MNTAFFSRPLVLGLALAGSVGVGAAVAAAVGSSTPAGAQASTQASQIGLVPVGVTTPTRASEGLDATNVSPVTLTQAAAIAARQAPGRVAKTEAEVGPTGVSYDVTLIRPDGTAAEIRVDGRTGKVLSKILQEQPDPQDTLDGSHDDSDGSDQSDH